MEPTAADRVLASQMGSEAVNALVAGRRNEMVGIINRKLVFTPFEKAIKHHQKINQELLKLAEVLSL